MSWETDRKLGKITNHGKLKLKGGTLPKGMTSGRIHYYYDGSTPRQTRTSGKTRYIETDGNLQVIFRFAEDAQNIEFVGKIVDIYHDY